MVWSKYRKNDIYKKSERLNFEWSQAEVEEKLHTEDPALLPITLADTLTTHDGVEFAIAYVAEYLAQFDYDQDLSFMLPNWITIIGRIVTEERKAKRSNIKTLQELTVQRISYSGVNKIAAKMIKKYDVEPALHQIIEDLTYELDEANTSFLRKQILFDKGLIVASIIRKGYNRKRNKKETKN